MQSVFSSEKLNNTFASITGGMKVNGGDDAGKNTDISSQIAKNYEFYNESIDELQNKLKSLDSKFSMISLVLQNRKIPEEDLEKEKLSTLMAQNKDLNEEDFKLSLDEKNSIEILRFLEESLQEKTKTFRSKKLFIEHIRKIKDTQQNELSKLFDKLNQVEDEYLVIEKCISSLQMAHQQNTDEIKNINNRVSFVNDEKHKLEIESQKLEEELQSTKNYLAHLNEEITHFENKNKDYNSLVLVKLSEAEVLQDKLITEQFTFYEHKEKCEYIDKVNEDLIREAGVLIKQKSKKEIEVNAKMNGLRETLRLKNKSEDELKRIEGLLQALEQGETQKSCFCDLSPELKNTFFDMMLKTQGVASSKQNYSFYEQMISDFITEKDV